MQLIKVKVHIINFFRENLALASLVFTHFIGFRPLWPFYPLLFAFLALS